MKIFELPSSLLEIAISGGLSSLENPFRKCNFRRKKKNQIANGSNDIRSWICKFEAESNRRRQGGQLMEISSIDNSQHSAISSNDADHHLIDMAVITNDANQGGMELKDEIGEAEARNILEIIASTGKFWHDWDKLKTLLSFQLKQVLSEYPEAKITSEQQSSSLGETYPELVKRLDEALLSFVEGPPFTLQRLCEILLNARSIYPNLSKLALALEKNLLVTSTLNISTDPYPPAVKQKPEEIEKRGEEPEERGEEPQGQSNSVQNGDEHVSNDKDEVMTEAKEAEVVTEVKEADDMKVDTDAFEETV